MTIAEALAKFRFRMEDPDGEKWDDGSITQIYDILTEAQLIAVNLLVDAKKWAHLRDLEDEQSFNMSGGSQSLPSAFFRTAWLKGSDGNFYDVFEEPPKTTNRRTDFLQEDLDTAYGYVYGNSFYLKGYDSDAGTWILGYISEPSAMGATTHPSLDQHGNNLTLAIATWIAWGLDRQFDRQGEVEQQISKIFGITFEGKK